MRLAVRVALSLLLATACAATGCGPREARPGAGGDRTEPPAAGGRAPSPGAAPAPASARPRIVMLGDSLTAGLGLDADQAYPALIARRLRARGLEYEVVNAGVSGDTSAGGLRRLDWSLEGDVRILVVALGGNDALRGLAPEELRRNLAQIVERAGRRGISVVLAGMEAPPNFGRDYTVAFHKVYPSLAEQYKVAFVPFLLQGVAGDRALNQPDGIHPTARGAEIVAENVWAVLEPIAARRAAGD